MPLSFPTSKVKGNPEDNAEEDEEEDYGSDGEGDQNSIFVEVFVQEMHDAYSSYGQAKLCLHDLCNTTNSAERPNEIKGKAGWLQLGPDAGKVFYAAKLKLREPQLPKMYPNALGADYAD